MSNGIPDRNPGNYRIDHVYVEEFLSGLTHSQIAEKHNSTAKAVESLIRRRRRVNLSLTADELRIF